MCPIIYWEWYNDFWTHSVFESSPTQWIKRCLLQTLSRYSPLLLKKVSDWRGLKVSVLIPRHFISSFLKRFLRMANLGTQKTSWERTCGGVCFSKVANFPLSTLLRNNLSVSAFLRIFPEQLRISTSDNYNNDCFQTYVLNFYCMGHSYLVIDSFWVWATHRFVSIWLEIYVFLGAK